MRFIDKVMSRRKKAVLTSFLLFITFVACWNAYSPSWELPNSMPRAIRTARTVGTRDGIPKEQCFTLNQSGLS